MKKWLIGCLMILLFAAPPALAGHNKPDGSICNSGAYIMPAGSEYRTPTHHRKQCYECHEMIWEDHWTFSFSSGPTCQKQVSCGLCGVDFGPFGAHKFSGATCVAKAICTVCKKEGEIDPNNHDLKPHAAKAATCTEKGWNEYNACSRCNYTTYAELPALNHDLVPHAAKAPTCTEIGWDAYETCKRDGCNYTTYSELPALNHDLVPHAAKAPTCLDIGWDAYETCKRDGCNYTTYKEIPALNHDLEPHAAKAPTCLDIGWDAYETCKRDGCNYTTYSELPALNHDLVPHAAKAPTCLDIGWNEYNTCSRCNYTTYSELPALNHDLVPHAAKAPTCLDIGWNEYDTCSRCDHTTYAELPALNHDLVPHAAKAPTCLDIGWNEYDTCSRCDHTTYAELPALNHDLVHHDAKAASCLDIGWNEYDTCSRCDYATYYAELPALGHDYRDILVKPTCETDGYTLFACSRCNDSYTEKPTGSLGHWFGEWSPKGNDSHIARCLRRNCNHTRKTGCRKLKFQTAENESLTVCPVCGQTENGKQLEMIEGATAAAVTGKLPAGEVTARTNGDYLILTFEYAGKLTQPTGQVKITLPVELPEGRQLERIAPNGAQAELPYEINGGEISFVLDFTESEIPAMLIRLIPQTSSL